MSTTLVLALALSASAGSEPSDRIQQWTEDALFLVEELERLHPRPWFGCPRDEFEGSMDAFLGGIEEWDDARSQAEFLRLFARIAEQGRDGHTMLWPTDGGTLPLQLYSFVDGWWIVDAEEEELVGSRVTALGGLPIEAVAERLAPLLTRDNEWNLRDKLALALLSGELLAGVEVPFAQGGLEIGLQRAGKAETRKVALRAGGLPAVWSRPSLPSRKGVRWLEGRTEAFRYEVLEPECALYVQYNEVTAQDARGRTLTNFVAEVKRVFAERGLARLVLDVRSNGGGNNGTFGPWIDALKAVPFDRPGTVFALIGRHTFSAAGNFITTLERETSALLLGEPTGGAPNQFGDAQNIELPHHRDVIVRISTRYHEFSRPDDPRLTHEPQLAVPLRAEDFFAGHDPVLAAALTYAPPK
jgi:hypothetical protein